MSVNRLQRAVEHVRPAVRHQHAYLVGGEKAPVPIKLNQNESPLDLPEDLKAEILQGWASIAANRYPAEQPADLCDAIAEYAGWVPEGIMAGNGSNELTYLIGMACVEAGTRVVLPTPMFAFYEKVVRLYGGQVISAESDDELRFDAQRIAKLTRQHQPALVVLVSPNNPTGMAMTPTDITAVAEAAPGLVLVDEAYVEFSGQPSAQALLSAFPHLILLRTFSKALGLAGIRLGYLLGHPALMRELLKARVPFMVDRFSQHMALTVLRRPRLLQERIQLMKSGTRHLYQTLCEMPGFRVLPTEANFVTFRPPQDAGVLMRAFLEQGIIVRNMSDYRELDGFLRVNSGTPEENRPSYKRYKTCAHKLLRSTPVCGHGNMELVQVKIIGLSISASSGGAYVMLLGEPDGRYRLPIIIGGYEGRAIELGLEQIKPARPITHDLLCQFLDSFEVQVVDIVIHKLHERTFFAEIRYRLNGKEHAMDARPSDAIALAVRTNANIFVSASVLEEAGIVADLDGEDSGGSDENLSPVERMERRLNKAIAVENYEEAARLRDALKELKGDQV